MFIEQLELALARRLTHVIAVRVDEDQGGPGVDAETPPDFHVGVVDDRVLDFITADGFADAIGKLFVFEFGRMDADDDQNTRIFGFELGQVGQSMNAVDAAQGPEIEQDDPSLEIRKGQRLGGIEPGDAARQVRGGKGRLDLGAALRGERAGAAVLAAAGKGQKYEERGQADRTYHQGAGCLPYETQHRQSSAG